MHRKFVNNTSFLLAKGELKYSHKTSQVRSFNCVHYPSPQPPSPQVLVNKYTDLEPHFSLLWSKGTMRCLFEDNQFISFSLV